MGVVSLVTGLKNEQWNKVNFFYAGKNSGKLIQLFMVGMVKMAMAF